MGPICSLVRFPRVCNTVTAPSASHRRKNPAARVEQMQLMHAIIPVPESRNCCVERSFVVISGHYARLVAASPAESLNARHLIAIASAVGCQLQEQRRPRV